ncbi:cytochrome P450 [Planomonospora sp. ID82291]|uniref:cytochrome P450 n=1 Tax=Planomonospora sp. ID82291 TaxID=2738136 RepID=UPI0018C442F4|nr:cytochrome P450 [Planomonospora sp. ID82291]MBG0816385.1 cytochrome P450 [Planomonospora sp. ID82291]
MPIADHTLLLLLEGYGWLPAQRRRAPGEVVHTRVMGQRAVGLGGPEAARFFYDEEHIERHTALPGPVKSTLFGHGAVHTLDGADHRVRKAMFMSLMTDEGVTDLVDRTTAAWDEAVASWAGAPEVVLFDEAARVITRGVCRWAGIPLRDADAPAAASDLVALVDGFGGPGARHWRARRARARREAWLGGLVRDVRDGAATAPRGSALDVVAFHHDAGGELLDPRVAAVELLNVVRPTVAVCWFVTFAAHALHRWPRHRAPLAGGDEAFTEAFVHEVRRFYPFAPLVGGRALRDLTWRGERIPAGALVLLDVYGHNHDPRLWESPYTFDPGRFTGREIGEFDLIPQGGGDPRTGHRCPGEAITVALLKALVVRLARLDYRVPDQDLGISLRRVPARLAGGFVMSSVRPAVRSPAPSPRR